MVFSLSTPKKETEKWKKLSKSNGLICCCNFIRKKPSSICRSPIYTTREFSLDNLQNQIIGENNINTSSKQRPISNNANGLFNKIIPNNYFSDEIISNREDYLDCDETPLNVRKTKEDLLYNTARTSRTEELIEYPSMSKLIIKIIENEKSEKGKKIDNQQLEDKFVNSMNEVSKELNRLDACQSPTVLLNPALLPSSPLPPKDLESQSAQMAIQHHKFNELPYFASILWNIYLWVSSSLVLFFEWIF